MREHLPGILLGCLWGLSASVAVYAAADLFGRLVVLLVTGEWP